MRVAWAEWRGPIYGRVENGFRHPAIGVIMHIMGAKASAADNWFHSPNSGNPDRGAGCQFGICNGQSTDVHPGWVDGHLLQWADTDDRAWHAGSANINYIGIETEGVGGPLTEAQVQTFARLLRELQAAEGFPFRLADAPGEHGLGWHGMGGSAYGGHPYCPGEDRKRQRARILSIAQGQPPEPHPEPQPEDDDMALIKATDSNGNTYVYLLNGGRRVWLSEPKTVAAFKAKEGEPVEMSWKELERIPELPSTP